MLQLRDGIDADMNDAGSGEHEDGADSDGECMSHGEINKKLEDLKSCPLEAGELQIVTLGRSFCSNIIFPTKDCLMRHFTMAGSCFGTSSITDSYVNACLSSDFVST